ncbi:hypothetical protein [Ehrlichia japonica]|uniref:Uncharacterized protein n=1 Tax=Ehrlichia japonica TaxID=391036 RepID=X5GAN6_9RICK|nr:hypothetical protein [Ehrlichia japonica]AHX04167.1 hypothetical protein EHF_0880 [Ehrlichia japonica]
MSYFYYMLSYITDNLSYVVLLALILFAGTAYLLKRKTRNKSKYKKSTYTNTSSSGSSAYKPYKRNYVVEHSSEHSKGSCSFIVESVSQVFEAKTQGKHR